MLADALRSLTNSYVRRYVLIELMFPPTNQLPKCAAREGPGDGDGSDSTNRHCSSSYHDESQPTDRRQRGCGAADAAAPTATLPAAKKLSERLDRLGRENRCQQLCRL